ncbi:MAG: phenylalanine--tRNA ligase subunit beta [Gemmatimonadota bacterium]|nr:phenylalanine--tRNA ligase subunit beta [Gemmatimonadota bacterium]
MSEHLALRGAPLDGVASPGRGLADVVMGRVVSAEKHPNADRLTLCKVDGGKGIVSVVCGAPNVLEGAWYPFAPVGAVLPGDLKLKKVNIRGELSHGMLCSAKELELGSDHGGIYQIHGKFIPGESFIEAMGMDDITMDVEITANRGDLLSHLGIARELAHAGNGTVLVPDFPDDPKISLTFERDVEEARIGEVGIRIEDPDLCSRYLGAVIRGVSVCESPAWLQQRLRGAGARPINNVVDATNYVMLELGQPLHAFDLNKLEGTSIVVRRAREKESEFATLDEEQRALSSDMLMICDLQKPVAIGGVMGGLESEVTNDTVDVLLEGALFNPQSIRATRKRLGLSTDASYRFERGVDPEGIELAVSRAAALILSTAGGVIDGPVLDCCPVEFEADVVSLRLSRIEHVLGIGFTSLEVRSLLEPLGFQLVDEDEGVVNVRVPGFRSHDVTREIDLIEEIARTHGYDKFPAEMRPYRPSNVPDHPMFELEEELRRVLASRGLFEAQTPAFVPESEGDVQVANPLTSTEPFVRRAILPSLLRRVEHNFAHGNRDIRLFEIATSFRKAGTGEPPREETHLAVVMTGRREPSHWSRQDEFIAVWDLKALLETVARISYAGAAKVTVEADVAAPFHEGIGFAVIDRTDLSVGHGGLVLSSEIDAPVWSGDIWGFEITLPSNPLRLPAPEHVPLPTFPAIERDLALVVPIGHTAAEIDLLIRESGGALLEFLEMFDLYSDPKGGDGTRSLAFRLRFRSADRTLKDKEVDKSVDLILRRLKEELDVEPRG